jgi:hypothetical protein
VVKAIFVDENPEPIPYLKGGLHLNTALIVCMTGVALTGFASIVYDYIHSLM